MLFVRKSTEQAKERLVRGTCDFNVSAYFWACAFVFFASFFAYVILFNWWNLLLYRNRTVCRPYFVRPHWLLLPLSTFSTSMPERKRVRVNLILFSPVSLCWKSAVTLNNVSFFPKNGGWFYHLCTRERERIYCGRERERWVEGKREGKKGIGR